MSIADKTLIGAAVLGIASGSVGFIAGGVSGLVVGAIGGTSIGVIVVPIIYLFWGDWS